MNTPVSFELSKVLKEKNIISSKLMYASNGNLTDSVYDFDEWCFAPRIKRFRFSKTSINNKL